MLIAPEAYPNAILATATPRFRKRTLRRTRETAEYRASTGPSIQPLEHSRRGDRPPAELDLADDVLLRHHPPVAAVRAVVPMIAHDEIVALGNDLWSPFIMASILGRDVVVVERDVVHVNATVHDAHGITFFGNDPLHEWLVRVERVVKHTDVASPWLANAIHELVHDQAILILEGWGHALPFDTRDLNAERHDQDGVHGCRDEGLHPGDELFFQLSQTERGRRGAKNIRVGCGRKRRRLVWRRVQARAGLDVGRRRPLRSRRYIFRYSRSRRVCVRLTGISVALSSVILRM